MTLKRATFLSTFPSPGFGNVSKANVLISPMREHVELIAIDGFLGGIETCGMSRVTLVSHMQGSARHLELKSNIEESATPFSTCKKPSSKPSGNVGQLISTA